MATDLAVLPCAGLAVAVEKDPRGETTHRGNGEIGESPAHSQRQEQHNQKRPSFNVDFMSGILTALWE